MPIDNLDRADSRTRCLANGSRWWSKQSTSRECSSRLTQIAIRHHQVFLLEPPWIHRYNPTRPSEVRRPNRDHKPTAVWKRGKASLPGTLGHCSAPMEIWEDIAWRRKPL